MTPLPINVPPGAEIANYLYPEMELNDLEQDIVTVRLHNGYYIDVGWYPVGDPNGRYLIRVFFQTWDRQTLFNPVAAKDAFDVVANVEKLADHFSRAQIPMSRTGGIQTKPKILAY
jgi:hypothetical protein